MKKYTTLYLTRGALIAALYVSLTYASSLFGLSSGAIQFRLSEMLCILPVFMPEAVVGLTLGCLIANLLTGAVVWDIIFGSLATLMGAVGARLLSKLPDKFFLGSYRSHSYIKRRYCSFRFNLCLRSSGCISLSYAYSGSRRGCLRRISRLAAMLCIKKIQVFIINLKYVTNHIILCCQYK